MSRKVKLISFLLIGLNFHCLAQEKKKKDFYFEPEYMVGKILPNAQADDFPSLKPQQVIALSIGNQNSDTTSWAKYYNSPETGVVFLYANLGDNETFGHQFGILPFITFHLSNRYKFKLSAGASYFSTFHDRETNPRNESVGSHFTWDIKGFIYRDIIQAERFNIRVGAGFSHESNGHTKLPNLGLNSILASVSAQFHKKKQQPIPKRIKGANRSPKTSFLTLRQGYGFHEQDATEGPRRGRSKPVHSTSIAYGLILNNHIKVKAGLIYRFYEQYYTHLNEEIAFDLNDNQLRSSSNVIFFIGNEYLMSHFGIEVQLGFNLYKPFYNQFNQSNDVGTVLRKVISSRAGFNAYLNNTNKSPKHNFFIGAHINANMAKADFSEFSIGYTYKVSKRH